MVAEDLFRAGKLKEAIECLGTWVRDNPTDARARSFLFELLCFSGELGRVEKHLTLLASENAKTALGALLYGGALSAERTRREIFESGGLPPAPEEHDRSRMLNGNLIMRVRDADTRIGVRLEVFAAGEYLCIPFDQIESIQMHRPKTLRDLLWSSARLRTKPDFQNRDLGEVLLPVLAPHSYKHSEDVVRLGRPTDFCVDESGNETIYGQKLLLVDGEEFPLLELRELSPETAVAHSAN